jgi:hypothetical protein
LLKRLERFDELEKFAVIDGDDVGRIVPLVLSKEWLNLIQDNIVSCAKNYRDFGVEYLIIGFVFPSEERLERLTRLLAREGIEVVWRISLLCDDKVLEERINSRNTSRIMNVKRAIDCNHSIRSIKSDFTIDTTEKNPEETETDFCANIMDLFND